MGETRKTVTIVFSDMAGSTRLGEQLDPEALRRVMERYFTEMRGVLERHGGTVEKFIGDAVMAAFGIPAAHEDDALRAVRAAAEMRAALAGLNESLERERGVTLAIRTGINTGEVVAGDPVGGHFYATGDAVNVAARLEQAAAPAEILLSEKTYGLVRDAVRAEPVEPLTLKGKAEAATAYRLLEVIEGAPALARRFDTPFVGREDVLASLLATFERSIASRSPALATVLGDAGIGKTRLAAELAAEVHEHATVLQGRCLSYGEGITFWPLQEILRSLPERPPGAPDPDQAKSTEEIFWAYRKLFEALAQERPLVLVLEDIHWAEPTLLDFIEHLVEWTREAPIMVLCLARPELLDERAGWPGERVELQALPREHAETLVGVLAAGMDPAVQTRAIAAAEGNPLFLEQMVALAADEDGERIAFPDTIQALLSARLDRLELEERELLESAAVVGKEFWRSALTHLAGPGTEVSALLQRLMRRRLIYPESSSLPGEDAFGFGHILIREAAYTGIRKEARADLHERLADWLEESGSYDEIVGYHLQEAYRYRAELGPIDARARRLAYRAGTCFAAAGVRASQRGDMADAAKLLDGARTLLPVDDPDRREVLLILGPTLVPVGEPERADAVLSEAIDCARQAGDETREWRARLEQRLLRVQFDPGSNTDDDLLREAQAAADAFEELGDRQGLAKALRLQGQALYWMGQRAAAAEAAERAIELADRVGGWHERAWALSLLAHALYDGPAPAPDAIRRCQELLALAGDNRQVAAGIKRKLAMLHAIQGETGAARRLVDEVLGVCEDLGLRIWLAATLGFESASLHWIDGDLAAAEDDLRHSVDLLTAMNEKARLSTIAAILAELLCSQHKHEEAEHFLRMSEETAGAGDWVSHSLIKSVRASLLAHQGEFEAAVTYARQALALTEVSDDIEARGFRCMSLAEKLVLAERPTEATPLLEEAVRLLEAKEHLPGANQARSALAELRAVPRSPSSARPRAK
jgi:class 3 adenylate cyclase/predicted ATPase